MQRKREDMTTRSSFPLRLRWIGGGLVRACLAVSENLPELWEGFHAAAVFDERRNKMEKYFGMGTLISKGPFVIHTSGVTKWLMAVGLAAILVTAVNLEGPVLAATGDPVLINEVLASHTGTDDTEYIEFFGIPGAPLDGLSLIVVESDNIASLGNIDRRIDFGPTDLIGANGFYLVGNPAGLSANYGVSPNLEIGNNFLENSSMTVALVETSSLSGSSVTSSEVVLDAVGITDGGAGDTFFFGASVIGPDGSFFPAGVRRVTDGVDTDIAADWVISDFFLGPDNTPKSSLAGNVDIKPGSCPNSINPKSKGVIPVAILTDSAFDATTVDLASLAFGPDGAAEAHGRGHIEDVDGDGDDDLVLHFRTRETGIACGDLQLTLTGETFAGEPFEGSDSVRTVGCK
jgi:hypothetical protein